MPQKSIQPRFDQTKDNTNWTWVLWDVLESSCDVPAWGSHNRTRELREYVRQEPILSGAMASMLAKASSLDWQITGGRNRVLRAQEVLAEAEDGKGWTFFLDRWLNDYLSTDLGGIAELARDGKTGPVAAVYNMDSECCQLTGRVDVPMRYFPKLGTGQLSGDSIPLEPTDYMHIVDMPATDESKHGLGFCAVSRAIKAARILLAMYNYEEERLADMPLPGIVAITGMTQAEVKAAFDLYKAHRENKQQTTFKGLLWLAAQVSPVNPIDVQFTPFSALPEGFDRQTTIDLYVYTLALDFGVDVREFWPASQTGATKAEAEIQHQKAKGKGFGRMLMAVERAINWDILPEGLEFLFDQQDSEDDLLRETIRERVIGNVRRLWEPPMGSADGIISTEEARRWLVELNAMPEWLDPGQEDITAHGTANLGNEEDDRRVADVVSEKAARAGLAPGEDYVTANSKGDVVTLWSTKRVFVVSDWPVAVGREVAPRNPFGTLTEYP